jgi:mRNA interferase MazF
VVEASEAYVPARGDVIWINLHPQAGHEQAGRRPAVVLSPSAYNGRVGLALLCPITHQRKGYPFEVRIPPRLRVTGVVLADQIKSLDWRVRQAEFICALPAATMTEVLAKLATLLSGPV